MGKPRRLDGIWAQPVRREVADDLSIRKYQGRRLSFKLCAGICLSCAAILVALPHLPALRDSLVPAANQDLGLDMEGGMHRSSSGDATTWLVVERLGIEAPILEGGEEQLAYGLWHKPFSAEIGKGNAVLSAHRFTYRYGEGVFYYLPNIVLGDRVIVRRGELETAYEVVETKEVTSSDVSILQPSAQNQLTLYTCASLLGGDSRFVARAVLAQEHETSRSSYKYANSQGGS